MLFYGHDGWGAITGPNEMSDSDSKGMQQGQESSDEEGIRIDSFARHTEVSSVILGSLV